MTERERLIELCKKANKEWLEKDYNGGTKKSISTYVADYLLSSGVIVPPCKVGDKVYVFANEIRQKEIQKIEIGKNGYMALVFGTTIYDNINQIGKTVFLTREEAEKALKEREK